MKKRLIGYVAANHTIINDFDRNVKVDNNNAYCIVD